MSQEPDAEYIKKYDKIISTCSLVILSSDFKKARREKVFGPMIFFFLVSFVFFGICLWVDKLVWTIIYLLLSLTFFSPGWIIRTAVKENEKEIKVLFDEFYAEGKLEWNQMISYLHSEHYLHEGGLSKMLENLYFWILSMGLGEAVIWLIAGKKENIALSVIFFIVGLVVQNLYIAKREFCPSRAEKVKTALVSAKKYYANFKKEELIFDL